MRTSSGDELRRERDALAVQLAHEWGWPDGDSVLTRLTGNRTAALVTFTDQALVVYLGVATVRLSAAEDKVQA